MSAFIQYKKSTNDTFQPSTGIQTLDSLINLSAGTVNCIYEDENSFIHNTLLQIFISYCLDRDKKCYVLSTEEKLLRKFSKHEKNKDTEKNPVEIKIAWRYKVNKESETDSGWDMLNKINIPEDMILNSLESLLECMKTQKSANFAIFSLFAPLYHIFDSEKIFNVLFEIKKYTRLNNHTVFLSLPNFLLKTQTSLFFDNLLQVHSELLLPGIISLYNSYLEILKIYNNGNLRVNNMESYKYGIVLKARSIKIERIDIPPEETPGNSGCGQSF